MTTETPLKTADQMLQNIEQADPVLIKTDDLRQVRKLLDDGYRTASRKEIEKFDVLDQRFRKVAQKHVDILIAWCRDRLIRYEGNEQLPHDQDIDKFSARFHSAVTAIVELVPGYLNIDDVQALTSRAEILVNNWRKDRAFYELEAEAHVSWESADKLERSESGYVINELLKPTLDKINAALQHNEKWSLGIREKLLLLRDEARRRYDDMRERHEIPTTRQEGGELVQVIIDFAERDRRNPSQLVTYFIDDTLSAQPQSIEVSKALTVARNRLVNLVWRERIDQYISSAKEYLSQHQPREALAALDNWNKLPGLEDDRVGVPLPRLFKNLVEDEAKKVREELGRLEEAERCFHQAELQSDLVEASKLVDRGSSLYPKAPDLINIKAQLRHRIAEECIKLLNDAQQFLKSENWILLQARLLRAKELIALDMDVPEDVRDTYTHLQNIFQRIEPLIPSRRAQFTFAEERKQLEALARDLPTYWTDWSEAQKRLRHLQASTDVQSLLVRADGCMHKAASADDLQDLIEGCQDLSTKAASQIPEEEIKKLRTIQAQLSAWLGFVRARDELAPFMNTTISEDNDNNFFVPPDLNIARTGIAEARQHAKAGAAVREDNLDQVLSRLERNDTSAQTSLRELEHALNDPAPDLNILRQNSQKVTRWLSKPTSYRSEFLEVRRELQQQFVTFVQNELDAAITVAKENYFTTLDISSIEQLLDEVREFAAAKPLGERVALPLAIAKAERTERQASGNWDHVRQAWEEAARLAARDPELKDYCEHRRLQASKQHTLRQARLLGDPIAAERVYYTLCEEDKFETDPEVWYCHGSHCLETVKQMYQNIDDKHIGRKASIYLKKARFSLTRSQSLINETSMAFIGQTGNSRSTDIKPKVEASIIQLEQWQVLGDLHTKFDALRIENLLPPLSDIRQMTTWFELEQTKPSLTDSTLSSLLKRTWDQRMAGLVSELQIKLNSSKELFEKIDILALFIECKPQDTQALSELKKLLLEAIQRLNLEVDDITYDYDAQRFSRRYQKNSPTIPKDKDFARLQLDEIIVSNNHLENLGNVLHLYGNPLRHSDISDQMLTTSSSALKDWLNQVQELCTTLDLAQRLIADALHVPEQFAAARYVLRMHQGEPKPTLQRVPEAFVHAGHPAYRAFTKILEENEGQRKRQEELRKQLEICFRFERAIRSDDLPTVGSDPIIERLRQYLRSSDPKYPLEEAEHLMKEMRRTDPYDTYGLQSSLVYQDPDDHDKCYESLQACEAVIAPKVQQMKLLRRWLAQFSDARRAELSGSGRSAWDTQRQKLQQQSHRGPHDLATSRNEFRKILQDLKVMLDALSDQAMHTYLQHNHQRNLLPGLDDQAFKVYQAATGLVAQRDEHRDYFTKAVNEAEQDERNLDDRIKKYEPIWATLTASYNQLMNRRRNWAQSQEWETFNDAATTFANICRDYEPFQVYLNDVYNRTRLDHPARKPH